MAKYIKLLMVALFATMTFALTSCGDDDDEPSVGSNGTISINGTKYNVDKYMAFVGEWDSDSEEGKFSVVIDYKEGKDIIPWPYDFNFKSKIAPKVGDDLSEKELTMFTTGDYYTGLNIIETKATSGAAIVKNIDEENNTMTIQFSNLKMEGYGYEDDFVNTKSVSYIFDGTVTVDFDIR